MEHLTSESCSMKLNMLLQEEQAVIRQWNVEQAKLATHDIETNQQEVAQLPETTKMLFQVHLAHQLHK